MFKQECEEANRQNQLKQVNIPKKFFVHDSITMFYIMDELKVKDEKIKEGKNG